MDRQIYADILEQMAGSMDLNEAERLLSAAGIINSNLNLAESVLAELLSIH